MVNKGEKLIYKFYKCKKSKNYKMITIINFFFQIINTYVQQDFYNF